MSQHDTLTQAPADEVERIIRSAVAAMPNTNPLVADDLIAGHTMHTEAEDIVAIWRAALSATQPAQPAQAAQSETCPTCGESEPYSGACGTSASDMRALCKRKAQAAQSETALQKYTRFKVDETEGSPLEKLRAFCAFAMNEQDWFDVEPFFDLVREARSAQDGPVLVLYRREIGEGDWAPCTPEQYADASGSPHWDTKTESVGKQPAVAQGANEMVAVPREWRSALQKLAFMAETSGGTAGADAGLKVAVAAAKDLLARPYLYTHPTPAQPAPVVPKYATFETWLSEVVDTEILGTPISRGAILMPVAQAAAQYGFEAARAMLAATPTPPAQAAADARDAGVDAFLADVRAEIIRARAKFPGDRIMTVALAEEFGELVKAVLDESAANVRKEAVQTATMCARVVLDGDGSVNEWRAEKGLDALATHQQGGKHG